MRASTSSRSNPIRLLQLYLLESFIFERISPVVVGPTGERKRINEVTPSDRSTLGIDEKIALIAVALGMGIQPSPNLEGQTWNVRGIFIMMNLTPTQYWLTNFRGLPLSEGSPSYQRVYFGIAADWNQYLLRLQIYPLRGSNPTGGAFGNGLNNISCGGTLGGSKL